MSLNSKLLITSGCSFSECISPWIKTWPAHLARKLDGYEHVSKAMGSQGNGLISRGIIYQVSESLKSRPTEDIVVGIMWSGPDRVDFYNPSVKFSSNLSGWMENPTGFVNPYKNWVILNHGWNTEHAKQYYANFHSYVGSLIYTLENILRTQWFLKMHNIKYFMSTYTSEVMPELVKNHPETQHLYNQIDFSKFLPVDGEYEWCKDQSGLDFPTPGDNHPSSQQHLLFVEKVILPFVKTNQII